MNQKLTPKQWLSVNKGKTLNDYYKEFPPITISTNSIPISKEYIGVKTNFQPINNDKNVIPTESWITIFICVIGIVGFFLPWIDIQIMGLRMASINGYMLPKMGDTFMQINQNTGDNLLYLSYLIPLAYILITSLEFTKSKGIQTVIATIPVLCMVFFSYGLISALEMDKITQILGLGFYLSFAISIILFLRKFIGH